MVKELKPLIYSTGFGCEITLERFKSLSVHQIKMLLIKKGVVLVKNTLFDNEQQFINMVKSYGKLVEYENPENNAKFNYKDVLKLDGTKKKFGTGRGELPLHSDGGLLKTRVDILIMYAVQIQNLFFQGATTVCDHELACQEMPIYLKNILSKETFQVRVLEKGYYIKGSPSDWFTLPVFTDYGWGNSMYIYLPFINQAHASWESRILGFSDLENNSFFNELRLFLTKPKYYYRHFWTQGDLMIKDNRRVLHAREEYDEKATRLIYRGQVIDK